MLTPSKHKKTPNKIRYIFVLLLQVTLICNAQQLKQSFSFKETSVNNAIKEISKQFKTNILFNPGILPENVNITGIFKNLTLKQALDTVLRNTNVYFKYFKNDIVLFKKNEIIVEKHNITKPIYPKENLPEKKKIYVTDTITYTVFTSDTLVTLKTDIVKVPVYDTIKVYDTVKVSQKLNMPVYSYKPKKQSFIIGISFAQGLFFTKFHLNNPQIDSSGIIKSSLKEKSTNGIYLNLLYKYKSWLFETGLGFTKQKYTLDYSDRVTEQITRIDTIDKYYTGINGNDTTWVYITENRITEVTTIKNILSDLTYQYINIPFLAGYTKTFGKTTIEIKGGVLLSYYLGSKGYYFTFSPENKVSFNNTKAPNNKLNIDIYGAFAADYFLNEKCHIFVQPYVGYTTFTPGNTKTLYYTTSLQFGIQTGLRYYF